MPPQEKAPGCGKTLLFVYGPFVVLALIAFLYAKACGNDGREHVDRHLPHHEPEARDQFDDVRAR